MTEKTKSTELLQALADTEVARRQRQSTIGEKYGVPPLEREEYLKMIDGKLSLVTKVVEANGVPQKEVQAFIDESKKMWSAVPRGSAHDDLPAAAILHSLSTDVMAALEVLSLPLRNGIVIGPTHEPQPDPQQISTFNDASIVEITIPTLWFCNEISKAIAHTISNGVEEAFAKYKTFAADGTPPAHKSVLGRWAKVLFRYATQGAPIHEIDPSRPPWVLRSDILDAMEIFLLGHECGHHIAQGFEISIENISEENHADIIGRFVSMAVAKARNTPFDYFLIAGAGAPLVLGSFEMLLRARQVLATGSDQLRVSETHPSLADRLRVLNGVEPLIEFPALKDFHKFGGAKGECFIRFRHSLLFILDVIWRQLMPTFVKFHREGIRPAPRSSDYLSRLGL